MILPASTLASVLLLLLAFFCWGSWANFQRLAVKWRCELFSYDFAIGVAACVALGALFLGSSNSQELTMSDNLVLASYRKIAYAILAGALVSLANMLLAAALSVSGMAVALPLTFGIGLAVTSITNFIGNAHGANALLLFAGLFLVLAALIVDTFAYRSHLDELTTRIRGVPQLDPRTRLPVKTPLAARGIIIGAISGIVYGFFFPVVDASRSGDNGVEPYGAALLIGLGMFASTLFYGPFFINFPIQGAPLHVLDYFKGTKKQHFWGVLAGLVWGAGLLAALLEAASPEAHMLSAFATALLFGAPIAGVFWGSLAWEEFKGATTGVRMMMLVTLVAYIAGLAMVSLAPNYASK